MFHFRALMLGGFLLLPLAASAADPTYSDRPMAGHTIAVADFSGSDPEVSRFISETLLTDLAQSRQLRFAERAETRRALDELKLQSTGRADPRQLTQLGRLGNADRLIVGSYLEADGQIIINARLLDVNTGRLAEGGASNVSGERRNMLSLVHRLSHLFHRRVVGTDFVMDGEGSEKSSTLAYRSDGYRVRETGQPGSLPRHFLPPQSSNRSRVSVRVDDTIALFNPNQPITSLIIDTRGQRIERCMSPKIRRQDGSELWGSVHVDSDWLIANGIVSYATSLTDARQNARAGNNPLIVGAVGTGGGRFNSDAVVSDEDASAILQYNKRDRFLNKFHVIFIVESGQ